MRNAISPCDPPPQSVASICWCSRWGCCYKGQCARSNLATPCDVFCVPRLLAFSPLWLSLAYCLSETEIAFGLAVCLPSPSPSSLSLVSVGRTSSLLFVFLGCRHLVTRERKRGNVPTFALIFGPLRAGGGEVGWLSSPSLLSFPRSPLP